MTSPQLLCICITVFLLAWIPSPGHCQDTYQAKGWWMDQPYHDHTYYNLRVDYLDDVNITCEDNSTVQQTVNFTIEYWVIPDLTVMKADDYKEFFTIDGFSTWYVANDTMDLRVTLLQEAQFGFYHCHVYDTLNDEHHVIKKAINYKGPYFSNLWDKYRMNVIIGCSAALGMLLIVIIMYVVYMFRYQEEDEDEEEGKEDGAEPAGGRAGVYATKGEEAMGDQDIIVNHHEQEPDYAEVNKQQKAEHQYQKLDVDTYEGQQNKAYTPIDEFEDYDMTKM